MGPGGGGGGGAREGREAGHRRAAASSHLSAGRAAGIGRRAGGGAGREGMTGQVARGSCADSDADAAERNGARVRWKQQRPRGGGLGWWWRNSWLWGWLDAFELAACCDVAPLAAGNG